MKTSEDVSGNDAAPNSEPVNESRQVGVSAGAFEVQNEYKRIAAGDVFFPFAKARKPVYYDWALVREEALIAKHQATIVNRMPHQLTLRAIALKHVANGTQPPEEQVWLEPGSPEHAERVAQMMAEWRRIGEERRIAVEAELKRVRREKRLARLNKKTG